MTVHPIRGGVSELEALERSRHAHPAGTAPASAFDNSARALGYMLIGAGLFVVGVAAIVWAVSR